MNPTDNANRWNAAAGRPGVTAAIHRAAARTGVNFDYLMGQARIESGFNPSARARTSSATGLFQFIEQTWFATVRKHGATHGLSWAAEAIRQAPNGRYFVSDPGLRRSILDLRKEPQAASAMAAEFAADNQSTLEQRLARPMESVDLYLAHFLGAGGAGKFLEAHDRNPGTPAAALLPAAARANRSIFYAKDGSPRSVAEIRERFAAKLGGSSPLPPRPALPDNPLSDPGMQMALRQPASNASPSLQYARLAYLMLAEMGA